MAEVAGYGGSITFTNLTAGVKNWSLSYNADALETTDFSDSGNRTYIAGLKGWTATVEANWDSSNSAEPGDSASLTLDVDGTHNYSGTAILTGMSISQAVDGVVTVTYEFQGTGALTIT